MIKCCMKLVSTGRITFFRHLLCTWLGRQGWKSPLHFLNFRKMSANTGNGYPPNTLLKSITQYFLFINKIKILKALFLILPCSALEYDVYQHIYLQIYHYNFYKLCPEINESDLFSALKSTWLCSYLNKCWIWSHSW